jgi:threonine dehydratase
MNIRQSYSRICKYIQNTPLEYNQRLSDLYNCNIYLKREDLQITRSFKIRGAYNKVLKLHNKREVNNVVCASAGNHAQGIAHICNHLNINGHIFLPNGTPNQKISRILKFGGNNIKINMFGDNFNDSLEKAIKYSKKNDFDFVHPFNDYDIINGQGTITHEIFQEITPDIIMSCVGGGGLISGIINYCNEYNSNCKIYGVEPNNANSMTQALENGCPIKIKDIDTFVDGASVSEIGTKNYDIVSNNINGMLTVNNGELCSDIVDIYQEEGIILEPAGCLSISGLRKIDKQIIKNKNVVCILSGGNNDITRYNEILENKLIFDGLKHYFIIEFNQAPGQLKSFINKVLNDDNDIVRFEYLQKTNKTFGNVLIGIQTNKSDDINIILKKLDKNKFKFTKINQKDLIYNYIV